MQNIGVLPRKTKGNNQKMPIITSKELSAIEDILGAEHNLVMKYRNYAEATTDAKLKTQFGENAAKHQQHFDAIFALLK